MFQPEATISEEWLEEQTGLDSEQLESILVKSCRNKAGELLAEQTIIRILGWMREEIEFITNGELSELMEVNHTRISQLVSAGELEQDEHGRFPRRKTIHSAFGIYKRRAGEGKTNLSRSKQEAVDLDNELKRIEVAKARGSALPVSVVEKAWSEIVLMARQKFSRVGNKLAPRIPYLKTESEIESEVQREIDECLAELSKPVEYSLNDGSDQSAD